MKVEYANGLIYTGNLIYDEKFQNFSHFLEIGYHIKIPQQNFSLGLIFLEITVLPCACKQGSIFKIKLAILNFIEFLSNTFFFEIVFHFTIWIDNCGLFFLNPIFKNALHLYLICISYVYFSIQFITFKYTFQNCPILFL